MVFTISFKVRAGDRLVTRRALSRDVGGVLVKEWQLVGPSGRGIGYKEIRPGTRAAEYRTTNDQVLGTSPGLLVTRRRSRGRPPRIRAYSFPRHSSLSIAGAPP